MVMLEVSRRLDCFLEVDVPADGIYRFQVISGNTGFPGDNDVSVDGQSAGTIHFGAELAMKSAAKWIVSRKR